MSEFRRVYTELAVINVTPRGFAVIDMIPGLTIEGLQARTDAPLQAQSPR
jgi:3-oxoadipate CoA-transferase beta subunit